jgi:hypothetical protein
MPRIMDAVGYRSPLERTRALDFKNYTAAGAVSYPELDVTIALAST